MAKFCAKRDSKGRFSKRGRRVCSTTTTGRKARSLSCDMREDCTNDVTHIGNKGYAYCTAHSKWRKGFESTRKMTKAEIKKLEAGQTISYKKKKR